MVDFGMCIKALNEGKKIKAPEWNGYWFKEGGLVKVMTAEGQVIENPHFQQYIFRTDWIIIEPEETKKCYRIDHEDKDKGLWYDKSGRFTGSIHTELDFCKSKDLPMPFDPELVGWISATESLEELFTWFPKEDIEKLESFGWVIAVYEATKTKQYKNHLVICQKTSKKVKTLSINLL